MRCKGRIDKLEKITEKTESGTKIYFIVPDDWEDEIPEGYIRESELPTGPCAFRLVINRYANSRSRRLAKPGSSSEDSL